MISQNKKLLYITIGIILCFVIYKKLCIYGLSKNKCKYKFNQIKLNKKNKIYFFQLEYFFLIASLFLFG